MARLEQCKYDGRCRNNDPKHWAKFSHRLQDAALEGRATMDDVLGGLAFKGKGAAAREADVLVPETPSPSQRKKEGKGGTEEGSVGGGVAREGGGGLGAAGLSVRRRDTLASMADTPTGEEDALGDEMLSPDLIARKGGRKKKLLDSDDEAPEAGGGPKGGGKAMILLEDLSDEEVIVSDEEEGWTSTRGGGALGGGRKAGDAAPSSAPHSASKPLPRIEKKHKPKRKRKVESSDEEEEENASARRRKGGGSGKRRVVESSESEGEGGGEEVQVAPRSPREQRSRRKPKGDEDMVDLTSSQEVEVLGEEEGEGGESSNGDEDDEDDGDEDGGEGWEADPEEEVEGIITDCERLGERLSSSLGELMDKQASGASCVAQPKAVGGGGLTLKGYQLVGMSWLNLMHSNGVNGILADEMGLGKTIQTIAFIASLLEKRPTDKHLIVTSASTLSNWKREFDTWLPSARVVCYHGSQKERNVLRDRLRHEADSYDAIITTYSYFQNDSAKLDRKFLERVKFGVMVLDEGHSIKNAESKRYERLLRLDAERRFLLTGTPINNNLPELLTLLRFLMPDIFHDCDGLEVAFDEKREDHDKFVARVKMMMSTFVLRRRKRDVLGELSPKTDVVHRVPMVRGQQAAYDALIARWQEEVAQRKAKGDAEGPSGRRGNGKGAGPAAGKANTAIFFDLRKAANHPLLVRSRMSDADMAAFAEELLRVRHFGDDATREQVLKELSTYSDWDVHCAAAEHGRRLERFRVGAEEIGASGKLRKLAELLPKLEAEKHRILLFSQWTTMLDVIEVFLEGRGVSFRRLDGSTPVAERQRLIDEYNGDPSILVFLISTKAGGLGINLTSADTVVLHDLDFNPQNDRQAEDRCHRIGQLKPVTVIKLVSKGSVDEKIYSIAESKRSLADGMLGEGEAGGGGEGGEGMLIADVLEGLLKEKKA